MMNFILYVIIAGIIQGHFLGLYLLLSKRGNRKANRLMGVLILLMSMVMSHPIYTAFGIYNNHPHLFLLLYPIVFLFGPIFLFYERTLIFKNYVIDKTKLFHFIPFVGCIAFLTPFYFLNADVKLLLITGRSLERLIDLIRITDAISVVQVLVYLYIINSDLKDYHNKILKSYSSLEKINLNWLRFIVRLFLSVYAAIIVLLLIAFIGYKGFANTYGVEVIHGLVALCVYAVGYKGLFQPEIFVSIENDESEKKPSTQNGEIESFSKEEMVSLLDYMREKKPYLKEDLTLTELAKQIGMSRNQLSALINAGVGENFYTFINKYRVDEVKRLITDSKNNNFTILSLAYEAGFPSKSSFHTVFKKITGLTPTEYRDTLSQS